MKEITLHINYDEAPDYMQVADETAAMLLRKGYKGIELRDLGNGADVRFLKPCEECNGICKDFGCVYNNMNKQKEEIEMRIVNCTPHPVTILGGEDNSVIRVIQPEEKPIRLKASTVPAGEFDGIPLSRTVFGEPENLPEPEEGTLFIVSQIVKNACSGRSDLVVPAEVVRDGDGNIVGCKSLGRQDSMRIMVRDARDSENDDWREFDSIEWEREAREDIWPGIRDRLRQNILSGRGERLEEAQFTLSFNPAEVVLWAQCTIPGVSQTFVDMDYEFKVEG